MRDYRALSAHVFVGECIEQKMKWLGRQLRITDTAREIEKWAKMMSLLSDLLWKLKNQHRSFRKLDLEIQTTPTIGVFEAELSKEAEGLSGIEMNIEDAKWSVQPEVELNEDGPESNHTPPLADTNKVTEPLKDEENNDWSEIVKDIEEIQSTMNEEEKKWQELQSTMNEEEHRWWEVVKGLFEGDEEAGEVEGKENVQRYIRVLIGKAESVLAIKLTRIPRKRRSRLWRILNQGARLLLMEKTWAQDEVMEIIEEKVLQWGQVKENRDKDSTNGERKDNREEAKTTVAAVTEDIEQRDSPKKLKENSKPCRRGRLVIKGKRTLVPKTKERDRTNG